MDALQFLPLPKEVIHIIVSYYRWLSVKKIQTTDNRYEILKSIPNKQKELFTMDKKGFKINFSNPYRKLFMKYDENELMISYVNMWHYEGYTYIYR